MRERLCTLQDGMRHGRMLTGSKKATEVGKTWGILPRYGASMSTYVFLSDPWIEHARRIRAEAEAEGTSATVTHSVRVNLVITDAPFSAEPLDAHVDTTSGVVEIDSGHIDPADMTVTVDHSTARSILVEGNTQVAMQAFMTGKIKVEGDVSKLIDLQSGPPGPAAQVLAERLREITE
jgi:putative sterol carrier protein